MAGAKKPRKISKPDSDVESHSDESGSYDGPQEIQATFEGRNPESHDFHGIKQLLQQLFLAAHIDVGQMTDMLISQPGVGSVLKQSCTESDDEEDMDVVNESDVFGITSIINLFEHKETPCVKELYAYVEEESKRHADQDTQAYFRQIFEDSNKIGFIINERFVNIPSKISPLMLNSLQDEIVRMKKKNNSYDFDYFLMISKIYKPKVNKDSETIFSNDEEEIFDKNSDYSFYYSVADKSDTGLTGNWQSEDEELLPYRSFILFRADKLPNILHEVNAFVLN